MGLIKFKMGEFEGPLDLLLHLISKHKMNIYDIEISLLLEQYMEYMDELGSEDYEQTADFLEMAARLIYIKTCTLLPQPEEAVELKKELEGAMIEYAMCKAAAAKLREQYAGGDIFVRLATKMPVNKTYTRTHDAQILYDAYMGISAKVKKYKPLRANLFSPIVSKRIVSVTSKIIFVLKKLYKTGLCEIDQLYVGIEDKSEKVATFLAVLELTKSGRIYINEDNTEIKFNKTNKNHKMDNSADAEKAENTVLETDNLADLEDNDYDYSEPDDEPLEDDFSEKYIDCEPPESMDEIEQGSECKNIVVYEHDTCECPAIACSAVIVQEKPVVKFSSERVNLGVVSVRANVELAEPVEKVEISSNGDEEKFLDVVQNVAAGKIDVEVADVPVEKLEDKQIDSVACMASVELDELVEKVEVTSNGDEEKFVDVVQNVAAGKIDVEVADVPVEKLEDKQIDSVACMASVELAELVEKVEVTSNGDKKKFVGVVQSGATGKIDVEVADVFEEFSTLTEPPETVTKPNYWGLSTYYWGNSIVGDDGRGNFWKYSNRR